MLPLQVGLTTASGSTEGSCERDSTCQHNSSISRHDHVRNTTRETRRAQSWRSGTPWVVCPTGGSRRDTHGTPVLGTPGRPCVARPHTRTIDGERSVPHGSGATQLQFHARGKQPHTRCRQQHVPASPENEHLPIVTQRELDKLKISSRSVCQPNFFLRLSRRGRGGLDHRVRERLRGGNFAVR